MTTPEPLDLDAIRAPRWPLSLDALRERYRCLEDLRDRGRALKDVHVLIAEVTALRAELDAARAERTEPATGEDVARMFHETYERLAPDYGYRTREASAKPWDEVPEQNRALMVATVTEVLAARAERTEPAMGEDVDVVALFVHGRWHGPCDCVPDQTDRNAAGRILAALDLPGREQALREEIERLTALADEAWDALKNAPKAGLPLESTAFIDRLAAEREYANTLGRSAARLAKERDQAKAEADLWWKRSEAQVDTIAELRDEIERLKGRRRRGWP